LEIVKYGEKYVYISLKCYWFAAERRIGRYKIPWVENTQYKLQLVLRARKKCFTSETF